MKKLSDREIDDVFDKALRLRRSSQREKNPRKLDRAIQLLEDLVEKCPEDQLVYFELSKAFHEAEQHGKAITALESAIAWDKKGEFHAPY